MLAMLLFIVAGTTNFVHANPIHKADSLVIYVKRSVGNIRSVTEPDKFTKTDQQIKIKKTKLNSSLRKIFKLLMEAESNNNTASVNRKKRDQGIIDLVGRSNYTAMAQFLTDLFVNTDEGNTITQATKPVDTVENPQSFVHLGFPSQMQSFFSELNDYSDEGLYRFLIQQERWLKMKGSVDSVLRRLLNVD